MPAAFKTLEDLRRCGGCRNGFGPDEVVYNTLLEGCAQAGLITESERVFEEMQAEGLQPSSYTLTVMVKLMAQARRLDRAFQIVEIVTTKYRFKAKDTVYSGLI